MSEQYSVPQEVYDALDRLYDDPEERIDLLREEIPPGTRVDSQTAVFKSLANPTRLRLLWALREGELCGCELQATLNVPQSTIASHLQVLKDAGLVKSRKKGKWSYNRIGDTATIELLNYAAAIEVGDE